MTATPRTPAQTGFTDGYAGNWFVPRAGQDEREYQDSYYQGMRARDTEQQLAREDSRDYAA